MIHASYFLNRSSTVTSGVIICHSSHRSIHFLDATPEGQLGTDHVVPSCIRKKLPTLSNNNKEDNRLLVVEFQPTSKNITLVKQKYDCQIGSFP